MSRGLEIRDPATLKTVLDMTMPICRVLGSIDTGTGNGGVAIPELGQGMPFFVVVPLESMTLNGFMPVVTLNGTTISWMFSYEGMPGRFPVNVRIFYGVY